MLNQSCFAREWFERKLMQNCANAKTFDIHSECFYVENEEPTRLIKKSIESLQNPIIVFPDIGASNRYINIIPDDINYIVMDKVRDQLSGKITGMKISKLVITDIKKDRTCNYDYLIVDDISDYGGTFKLVSSVLKSELTNINTINLYVSHLLGHGGLQSLHDAGISKVFTSDSLTEYRKSKNLLADEVIFNIK